MKALIIILTSLIWIASGCYKKDLSPRANVTENGTGGFWKLSEYTVRGKSHSVSEAQRRTLIEVRKELVKNNDQFSSSLFRPGIEYNVFVYSQTPEQKTFSVNALRWGQTYSKKKKQQTSWFKIDDNTGFLVILDVDASSATSSKMQVSNIIKSSSYIADLDTIKYTYSPTLSWQ